MGLINRLYDFASEPKLDPDIGTKIDGEINQILNLLNGAIDDANVGGNPDIDSAKLSLGGAGFLPLGGGNLSALVWHQFSGIWRKLGAVGGVKLREYREASAGVAWGMAYNTEYAGGTWLGRDAADICMRFELSADGFVRFYWAPSAASGVSPVWYASQHLTPFGGSAASGNSTISGNQTVSGIFHYASLTINSGVTWTLAQGRPLMIFARESVTINGTLEANAKGRSAGAGGGEGLNGGGGSAGDAGGGGNGGSSSGYGSGGGGGGATYLGESIGAGGSLSLSKRFLYDMGFLGGAGGGGGGGGQGGSSPGAGGAGGNGGGLIFIEAPMITVNTGGIIRASGATGAAGNFGDTQGGGGGGGGGGGVIYLRSKRYSNSGTVSTPTGGSGGAGGGGGPGGNAGSSGGSGVLYIEELK